MKYLVFLLSLSTALIAPGVASADVSSLLVRIKSVGREGQGNVAAIKAWQELVQQGPGALPAVLTGMDDADPIAINWLRAAVESIADQAIQGKQPIPSDQLEAFLKDTRHAGLSRRLAYEVLQRVNPSVSTRLLPGMLNDPSQELRRDAVELAIKQATGLADKGDPAAAEAFKKAFAAARDRDQVDAIAEQLKKLGVEVDLARHFGFVRQWMLVTPFDNRNGVGFAAAYPPEKGIDLMASYDGKQGAKAAWKEFTSTDPYGWVDLNKVIGPLKGTVAYAYAVVNWPREQGQAVEFRAGSPNALKIFLNGKEIFFREEYHHGSRTDTHVGKGVLKPGRNELLLKVCQNEQTESWAQEWKFQLRICDDIGGAVPVEVKGKK